MACGNTDTVDTTEPEPVMPSNLFGTQANALQYMTIGENTYILNADMPQKLQSNGFAVGTSNTGTALALGYPKGDAKYLYYQCDNSAANCVYCCVVDDYIKVTISYRVLDPVKLGVESAMYTTANTKTYYADYISSDKSVDDVLKYLGEPTSAETNDSGFITGLTYIHKNENDEIDNKIEIEFVSEKVYKLNVTRKLISFE